MKSYLYTGVLPVETDWLNMFKRVTSLVEWVFALPFNLGLTSMLDFVLVS